MSEHDWRFFTEADWRSLPQRLAPTPNPDEIATLVVGGRKWDDWTSVKVENRYAEAFDFFTFSNVERPVTVQFRPGDECAVYLGGLLAIAGVITVRQVAYDANNHGIQFMGKSVTWYPSRSSIIDEAGNFDGHTFEQVAKKLIAPFGVGVQVVGKLNDIPFDSLQVEPGVKLWDYLENLARPKGIVMGSDALGNFLLIGDHATEVDDVLVEGVNIKGLKFIISVENVHSEYLVRGQRRATDESAGAEASQQEAKVSGSAHRYSPLLTPAEQPVWGQQEILDRAKNEAVWHEGDVLQALVTVQGWKRSGGGLWRAGQNVHIVSPMAPLDQQLTIQSVIFSQDSASGTTTQLECVPPFLLRGEAGFNVGRPGVIADPTTYENAKPAAVATSVPEPPPLILAV
jgi:prophage tail gpP-like protein